MKKSPAHILKRQDGVALLLTLAITMVLVATVLEFNRRARSAVESTGALRNQIILNDMASSAVHAAMAALIQDKRTSKTDTLQEDWANPEKIQALIDSLSFPEGKLALKITDEHAKIQLNALVDFPEGTAFDDKQKQLWERLFSAIAVKYENIQADAVTTILNSTKDWLDAGDDDAITGITGAESDYYQGLDPGYECRNGPFLSLDEFFLVRGIRGEFLSESGVKDEMEQYLTVYGMSSSAENGFTFEGKININTAPEPIIAALLPLESRHLAQSIYEFRMEKAGSQFANDLSNPKWYKNAPGCSDLEIDPALIRYDSDVFKIDAAALYRGMQKKITAVVIREKDPETNADRCKILRMF